MLFSVWHDKAGPFVQMTHLLYGIGGIVSPLVAKPFLIKVSKYLSAQTATTDDFAANSSVTNWQPNCSTGNETMVDMDNASIIVRCNSTAGFDKYTRVHFAYLIGALLMASAALPFLIFYTQGKVKEQAGDSQTQTEQSTKVFGKPRIFIVISLLTIVHGVGMALTDAFPIFLAMFGIFTSNGHKVWAHQ